MFCPTSTHVTHHMHVYCTCCALITCRAHHFLTFFDFNFLIFFFLYFTHNKIAAATAHNFFLLFLVPFSHMWREGGGLLDPKPKANHTCIFYNMHIYCALTVFLRTFFPLQYFSCSTLHSSSTLLHRFKSTVLVICRAPCWFIPTGPLQPRPLASPCRATVVLFLPCRIMPRHLFQCSSLFLFVFYVPPCFIFLP